MATNHWTPFVLEEDVNVHERGSQQVVTIC